MSTASSTIVIGRNAIITPTPSKKQFGVVWAGSAIIAVGATFTPGSTELIVSGRFWALRSSETESPDIWEYEELTGNQSIQVRYPDSIGNGEPVIVRFMTS
jgi:hypothetical protein